MDAGFSFVQCREKIVKPTKTDASEAIGAARKPSVTNDDVARTKGKMVQ